MVGKLFMYVGGFLMGLEKRKKVMRVIGEERGGRGEEEFVCSNEE